ncbi:hypothetical protein [Levilactobacillus phage ENFP1]|nr:hypothetical protein [Levilactobacillus phage ENFP1]
MFVYIKFDENGYITDFKKEPEDGYTKSFVLNRDINNFAKFSDKFRWDTDSQAIITPSNLPKTVDYEDAMSQIASLSSTINSLTNVMIGGI